MHTEHVHGQPFELKSLLCFFVVLRLSLKMPDNLPELLFAEQIIAACYAVSIQKSDQRKIRLIRRSVHAAAFFQITEDFQVCGMVKEALILMRILCDVPDEAFIDRVIGTIYHLG